MIKQKRRNETAKEKVVEFKLSKEMVISEMIKEGYRRKEVISLFEHLEELGFGEYIKGTRGVGNPTRFITNEKCPDSFSITFKVYRIRKTKEEKEKNIFSSTEDNDKISNLLKKSTKNIKLEPCPNDGKGYAIGVEGERAFLVRLLDGGFKTIEKAVKSSWHVFDGKISIPKSRNMKDFEQVASKLRGLGYIDLKG